MISGIKVIHSIGHTYVTYIHIHTLVLELVSQLGHTSAPNRNKRSFLKRQSSFETRILALKHTLYFKQVKIQK